MRTRHLDASARDPQYVFDDLLRGDAGFVMAPQGEALVKPARAPVQSERRLGRLWTRIGVERERSTSMQAPERRPHCLVVARGKLGAVHGALTETAVDVDTERSVHEALH